MGTVTAMGVIVLGLKVGLSLLSGVGVLSGVDWFNKKKFTSKKGGMTHESEIDSEKFSRTHL